MKIYLPSTILNAALERGSLSIESSEKRELDDSISPIFDEKDPSSGIQDEDLKSQHMSDEVKKELKIISEQLHGASEKHKNQAMRLERLIENKEDHNDEDTLASKDVNAWDIDNSHRAERDEDDLASYDNRKKAFEELSDRIQKSLEKKVEDHLEKVGDDKRKQTDKYILAVSFHRGVGAYHTNPSSVRPSVSSPEQWALARVNGFLYALENLKFKNKPYDTDLLPVEHPLSTREKTRAVGDIDPTNFPKSGDDKKVSLRNSEHSLFDREYAERIKEEYPEIWRAGGNILGNTQYARLTKILSQGGEIKTSTDEEAVRLREAWGSRHKEDFRLAGVVAQMKWLVIGSRGESYMKNLINDEIAKRDLSLEVKNMNDKEIKMRCIGENLKSDGSRIYTLSGNQKLSLHVSNIDVRAFDGEDNEIDVEESLRAINGRGRPAKYYSVEGIASSTSVDSYGTEMSYNALLEMQSQMSGEGIPLLPRHMSRENGQMAEWNEVIGRTYDADLRQSEVMAPADREEKHYTLMVRSRLYGEDAIARELVKRLMRGEPIGQSIGGWFNNIDVVENAHGEVERVIVRSVHLDHLAITRAPANPDSIGLATYSKGSTTLDTIIQEWRSNNKQEKNPRAFTEENIVADIETRSDVETVEAQDNKKETKEMSEDVLNEIVERAMKARLQTNANSDKKLSPEEERSILKEAIKGIAKDAENIEQRHVSAVEETEDHVIVHYEKMHSEPMMEMGSKMKEYMESEEGGKALLMIIEKKMEEYLEKMGMMEFDHIQEAGGHEPEEKRDLDHSASSMSL